MHRFEWREEFSVGIVALDAQHRHLMELLGKLVECTESGEADDIMAVIAEAIQYSEYHLDQEEMLLRARHYPGYAEHKAEHDAYRRKAARLQAQSGRRDFGTRVANFIADWWRFHVLVSDQRYARFFRRQSHNRVLQ